MKYIVKVEEIDDNLTNIGTFSSLEEAIDMARDYLGAECCCIDYYEYNKYGGSLTGWDYEDNCFTAFITEVA